MAESESSPTAWVRSGVLAGAAELMRELGGEPLGLARQCGIDPAALDQQDLPVQGSALVAFFEAAAAATGCADFGMRLASRQTLSVLGPLWMTMRSARTVCDALKLLVQFFVVHTNGALVGLQLQEDGTAFVTYNMAAGVGARDRQTIELGLALLCQELRSHCGGAWTPLAAQFCHARPALVLQHERCFGRHLSFDQDRNALWLDAQCLRTPLAAGSPTTQAALTKLLVSRVDSAQAVAAKVERAMRALMPFSSCSREDVAHIAELSPRSLQRRLAEAGTTFQELRDRVRADIALKYLSQSGLQAAQIADILGYSDPAAFTRAFKRQHGVTPSEARLRAAQVPPSTVRHPAGGAA